MADAVERLYAPPSPLRVIHNGRDATLYYAIRKTPFVLSAGRMWDEGKNVALVAQAAPAMPWPVYIAGDMGRGADPPGVTSLGRLSIARLAQWYARAPIYALPARYEPFGLSALEAALSGCALVLGDIPSLREVWGSAAVFVDPDDARGLADAVSKLAADEAYLHEMSARALARARRYSLEQMVQVYLALYRELSERRSTAPGGLQACAS
jgi:glycosyltransferase involved in cell wall biosynthesis